MASENLTLELWEIIQKNNQEEISYNDFEKDLNNAFNLPKDDVDRALSIMISQAEVNPNVIGEYKGGSFLISQSFTATVINTIKYENQFIPGKQEYIARESNIRVGEELINFAIITPTLISQMLDNFENLSSREISELAGSLYKMSDEDRDKFANLQKIRIQKEKENATCDETKTEYDKYDEVLDSVNEDLKRFKKGSLTESQKEEYRRAILESDEFQKFYFDITGRRITEDFELTEDILKYWHTHINKEVNKGFSLSSFYDKAQKAMENNDLKEFAELCAKYPEEAERYLAEFEAVAEKLGIDLSQIMEETGFPIKITPRENQTSNDKSIRETYIPSRDGRTLKEGEFVYNPGESFPKKGSFSYFIRELGRLNGVEIDSLLQSNPVQTFLNDNIFKQISEEMNFTEYYPKKERRDIDAQQIILQSRKKITEVSRETQDRIDENADLIDDLDISFEIEGLEELSQENKDTEKKVIEPSVEQDKRFEKNLEQYSYQPKIKKIQQSEFEQYYSNNFEILNFVDEKKSKQGYDIREKKEGEPAIIGVSQIDEQLKKLKVHMKANNAASKIVSVLRLIGSVRSGDVRDAQQAVTSLTKVGKNFEEATQTADEVEQGE